MFNTLNADGPSRKWWILANVSLGTFMATLDGSIANVGLPTISQSLHVPLHAVQWVVSAYLLAICAMLPLVGTLADRFGRGRLYNIGFVIFAAGSAACALSPSILTLIVSRVLQAVGASLLMANGQALIATTFPVAERGRAFGITGAMVSLGSLAGPGIGGILIGLFGWSSIFWVNVPIGIVGFLFGLYVLRGRSTARALASSFDYSGSALFIVGIVLLLYTVSEADVWGWSSGLTWTGVSVAIVILALFGWREQVARPPLIDLALYKNRVFTAASLAAMLSFISLFCTNTMMPFYLEDVLHATPQVTGWAMMTYPLTMAVAAPVSGWLSDRIGPFVLTTGGLTVNAIGFVLLNLLSATVPVWLVGVHLAIFGLGQGMFQSPNNASLMGTAPRDKVGSVGGLNALVRNLGMVFGISMSISVFSGRLHALTGGAYTGMATHAPQAAFMAALHAVFWTAAGVCVAGAVLSSLRSPRHAAGTPIKSAS